MGIISFLTASLVIFSASPGDEKASISWQEKVFEVQSQIKDIHPFLDKLYPVALVEVDTLSIYYPDTGEHRYVFIKKAPTPFPMPDGIEASFPLECCDDKTACVISNQVFSSLEGYATIFHEFIHCTQWETCELELKSGLEINRKAMEARDYSWELTHPFPYSDSSFAETYSELLDALDEGDSSKVYGCRKELKKTLVKEDYEYMVWQEWKEGFARLMENKIRSRLGFSQNHYGLDMPYTRVAFYEGGAKLIAFLVIRELESDVDIERLFQRMMDMG